MLNYISTINKINNLFKNPTLVLSFSWVIMIFSGYIFSEELQKIFVPSGYFFIISVYGLPNLVFVALIGV